MSDLPPPPTPPGWSSGYPGGPTDGPWGPPSRYGAPQVGRTWPRAGFWIRFAAVLIDGIVLLPISILPNLVQWFGPTEEVACADTFGTETFGTCEQPTDGAQVAIVLLNILAFVAGLLYYSLLEGRRGQTVGKKVCNIRVVDIDTGQLIGTGRGVGRYFARILSSCVCLLGYFWMLWDPEKQTWHDKLVRSVVVQD